MQEIQQLLPSCLLFNFTERGKDAYCMFVAHTLSFHPINIPLSVPFEGVKTQFLFQCPQKQEKYFLAMEILFVSCSITISGLTFPMVSLMELFFLWQPKPLTFREMIYLNKYD